MIRNDIAVSFIIPLADIPIEVILREYQRHVPLMLLYVIK